ncbi:MAG: Hsp20/alpha crystallin family protein [Candidatus Delongbacteria bacterium]|nr:Hsp20/alpha crystallin family protein [Candidatus Delongbacteria bacterium]
MQLVKFRDFDGFDKLMNSFFAPERDFFRSGVRNCKADVYVKNNNIIANLDLPGIDAKDIEITIEGNLLKVFGNREEEKEINEQDYYRKEIVKGSFERYITLPTNKIDNEKINASYKKGVLTIEIPKKEEERKKIEIKVEND